MDNVLRQSGSKLWCPWQQKAPIDFQWGNGVSIFSHLLLIGSFFYLQVTRTCIKSRMSSNFGQIGLLTTELAALRSKKYKVFGQIGSKFWFPILIKFYV